MDPKQRNAIYLGVIVVLVVVAWLQFWPPNTQIRQGLDIQGGVSVILEAEPLPGQKLDDQVMDRVLTILTTRVNALGASESSVQRQSAGQGGDTILVQLPGIKDQKAALEALGSTGRLEFVDVTSLPATEAANIQSGKAMESDKPPADLTEGTYQPILTGAEVSSAKVAVDENGAPAVDLTFNTEGTKTWATYTAAHIGQQVAIVLDGQVVSAPTIRDAITGGSTQISGGDMTAGEAKRLAAILQAGALPVKLVAQNTERVGPTLGQQALRQGLIAALAGLAIVAVFMAVFYRGLGVISWFSLVIFSSVFLGVLATLSKFGAYTLTLPGIAGIVLTIGLAADSSILMFERFKEEVRMGKTLRSAAKSGTMHAFWTSVDADIVTFVTALVLFAVAIGPVQGFALTLMIGIAIDLTVAFLFTRTVIMLLAESAVSKTPWLFGLGGGDRDA